MSGTASAVLLTLALVVLAASLVWLAWRRAVRIDRLHLGVLTARQAVGAQLERRAHAARELALSGALDPAPAVLLADAASACLDHAGDPLVLDGLAGADEPADRSTAGGRGERADGGCLAAERALGVVLGGVLRPEDRERLARDPRSREAAARLEAADFRLEVVLAVHATRVDQVRRARAPWYVRLLRLAGRAPLPAHLPVLEATGSGAGPGPAGAGTTVEP